MSEYQSPYTSMGEECSEVQYAANEEKLGSSGTKDPVTIIVTGKTGVGKSTAWNNIFHLDLEARPSPTSVTKSITTQEVTKDGVTLCIIDTPGLGSVDLKTKQTVHEMYAATKGSEYILLYCLPVKPSDTLTETDKIIVRNLQICLGKQVWDKCVVFLTFSDTARYSEFSSQQQAEEYKTYLKEHAQAFQHMLQECGADESQVKTIFECNKQAQEEQQSIGEIVAVPVAKNTERSGQPDIMPGILSNNQDWTDIAFTELMKKKRPREKILPDPFTYSSISLRSGAGILAMASLGGVIGALLGAIIGPLGILIGACIGAVVGGASCLTFKNRAHIIQKLTRH